MPLAQYMMSCNAHYYGSRDPLGIDGDFTTAPEISQMFGELIGLWAADVALRAERTDFAWVELGPGRGTLSRDALAAMTEFGLDPLVHLVEASPVLAVEQGQLLPGAIGHATIDTLPNDRPLIVLANEFFDALPIRQLVQTAEGWRQVVVGLDHTNLVPQIGRDPMDEAVPADFKNAPKGRIYECSPASTAIVAELSARIATQGGAILVVDYGYEGPALGDTFQAVKGHKHVDPFANPGSQDLTAHVDFAALADAGSRGGVAVYGPVGQGAFLERLGIGARANSLMAQNPDRSEEVAIAQSRLTAPEQMGTLFKVMALMAPSWPVPEGFQ